MAEDYAVTTALYEQSIKDKVYEKPDVQLELAFQGKQTAAETMQKVQEFSDSQSAG